MPPEDSKQIVVARNSGASCTATACAEDNKVPYPFPITRKADWAIPKNPHPHDRRHAGKSHGRWGLTAVKIQMGGGL